MLALVRLMNSSLSGARVALGLALVLTSASGCGKTRDQGQPPDPKDDDKVAPSPQHASAATPAADVDVVLLEAGAEPRHELRYSVQPKHLGLARMQLSITNEKDSSSLRDSTLVYAAEVIAADETGLAVNHVFFVDKEHKLVTEREQMSDVGNTAIGAMVRFTERGRATAFEPFGDDPALVRQYQGELQLFMAASWLPVEAVGVGAKWRIHTPDSVAQQVRAKKHGVTELIAIEGNLVTLRTNTTSDAPNQTLNGKEYENHSIRGTKTIVIDLADSISLLPMKLENLQSISMTQRHRGMPVTHRMRSVTSIERLGEAVSSD